MFFILHICMYSIGGRCYFTIHKIKAKYLCRVCLFKCIIQMSKGDVLLEKVAKNELNSVIFGTSEK